MELVIPRGVSGRVDEVGQKRMNSGALYGEIRLRQPRSTGLSQRNLAVTPLTCVLAHVMATVWGQL